MKHKKALLFIALTIILHASGNFEIRAHAAPETEIVVTEIQNLLPEILAIRDLEEREVTLGLMAVSLARLGRFETALRMNNHLTDAGLRQSRRDEIWRITAHRLAGQGNIAAAARCAERIKGEYSRIDAVLAIGRAHLRKSESDAARRIFKRVMPSMLSTQSPQAVGYLAYLFAQTGDATTARRLFEQARAFPYTEEMEENEHYNRQRAVVAYYQAACGWSREALDTAGPELSNLQPAKSLLMARREWVLLRSFADRLSSPQAVDFLLELSGVALQAKELAVARASLEAAKVRFASLSPEEQKAERCLPLQLRLALLEMANGDTGAGLARFTGLSQSPHFNNRWEFAFYYLLIAPQNRKLLSLSLAQQSEYEQKAISASMRPITEPDPFFPFDLHDIARAQKARGELSAARETLQLIKSQIRAGLVAPLAQGDSVGFRITRASNQLINLAGSERETGNDYRLTLSQAQTLLRSGPRPPLYGVSVYDYAERLIRDGFFDEATKVLQEAQFKSDAGQDFGFLPARAGNYALAKGTRAAMNWVRKFPDVSSRSTALLSIAIYLSRNFTERNELTLRGSDQKNLKINSRMPSNYRPFFDVTPFRTRE